MGNQVQGGEDAQPQIKQAIALKTGVPTQFASMIQGDGPDAMTADAIQLLAVLRRNQMLTQTEEVLADIKGFTPPLPDVKAKVAEIEAAMRATESTLTKLQAVRETGDADKTLTQAMANLEGELAKLKTERDSLASPLSGQQFEGHAG